MNTQTSGHGVTLVCSEIIPERMWIDDPTLVAKQVMPTPSTRISVCTHESYSIYLLSISAPSHNCFVSYTRTSKSRIACIARELHEMD